MAIDLVARYGGRRFGERQGDGSALEDVDFYYYFKNKKLTRGSCSREYFLPLFYSSIPIRFFLLCMAGRDIFIPNTFEGMIEYNK